MPKSPAEVVEEIRAATPYPADIFIEPTHEQFERFNRWLKDMNIAPDGYAGSVARRAWDACCRKMLERLQEEAGDDGKD